MRTLLTPVPLLADIDFIHFLTKLFVTGGRENSSPVSFFFITNYSNFEKWVFPGDFDGGTSGGCSQRHRVHDSGFWL